MKKQIIFIRSYIYFLFFVLGMINPEQKITLEHKGHLAVRVNSGYKIFDFSESRVIKQFTTDEKEAINEELEIINIIKNLQLTPRVYKVSEKHYTEEYLNYCNLDTNSWEELIMLYDEVLNELIHELINIEIDKDVTKCQQYITELKRGILNYSPKLKHDENTLHVIKYVEKKLTDYKENEVEFAFSHGDFSPKHVHKNSSAVVKLIDWETLGIRSLLFDFHNPIFQQIHRGNIPEDLDDKINIIEDNFMRYVRNKANSEISLQVEKFDMYKNLFFLERIWRIAEVNRSKEKNVENMKNWAKGFHDYFYKMG